MVKPSLLPKRGKDLNEVHAALMANGTDIERVTSEGMVTGFPVEGLKICLGRLSIKELAAKGKPVAAVTVGKEAEVADLGKSLGKNVAEESANEFMCLKGHGSDAVMLFSVSPLKRYFAVLECQQAVIGNGDAVGIAAEVIEDLS